MENSKGPSQPTHNVGPPKGHDTHEELFVWPWTGVVANIPVQTIDGKPVGESGTKLRDAFLRQGFKPTKVTPLWSYEGHSGFAIVDFTRDWNGFCDVLNFDKAFAVRHCGKSDHHTASHMGDNLYGWAARGDDYLKHDIVGNHLRKIGDLKSIAEIQEEEEKETAKRVSSLNNTLEDKTLRLKEMEISYEEICLSMNNAIAEKDRISKAYETIRSWNNVMDENDKIHRAHNEEMNVLQQNARDQLEKFLAESEKMNVQLEAERIELQKREEEAQKFEVPSAMENWNLYSKKRKIEKATLEQKEVGEGMLRLAEEYKREKEELYAKRLKKEKKLDAKHALELEIEMLRGQLQVMKYLGEDGDEEVKNKMVKIQEELKEKEEALEELNHLTEMQEA